MPSVAYLDVETFSEVPIANGTGVYAANCTPLMWGYAIDDAPARVWLAHERMPDDLAGAITDRSVTLVAHQAAFDRSVMRHAGSSIERAAANDLDRWYCTMTQALCHGLPGGLDKLCDILGIDADHAKDKNGHALVLLFCKPRPANHKLRRATAQTHPEEWARFVEYCRLDVEAMRAIKRRLPAWNYRDGELALWRLDQRINERGIAIDTELADAALRAVEQEKRRLAARTREATNGAVGTTTQRDALLAYVLAEHGVALPDMQADTLERRLNDPELPDAVRELIAMRLQASRASTAKYSRFIKAVNDDGRLRSMFVFAGASRTRRWAGRVINLQNLPRPDLSQEAIDAGIAALKTGVADLVCDDVMRVAANAIRGVLTAPSGKKLVVSDLAGIEARVVAWLGNEQWKLKAFADFDAGNGADLYKIEYARAFNVNPGDVTKHERSIGKVLLLFFSYQGGVGAFLTGAATYGIDLGAMTEACWPTLPADVIDEATEFLAWARSEGRPTFGLDDRVFIACESLKRLWRRGNPAVVSLWSAVETAVREAIDSPARTITCRRLKARRDGNWLRIGLPSGNCLCYSAPRVEQDGGISYLGVSQYTKQWQRIGTYGGRLVENACQSVARDILAHGMLLAEQHGYEIVGHVHDELICEVPDEDRFSAAELSRLMATNPPWADGLPLAAAGFDTRRYRKEQ